ncbi:TPA: hypothetical protein RTG21_001517 [Campylobacter jejuni]|nr:hypothetical protein [Campylobacter jejuni]HDZ4960961.1 hypothetical protein [Campylobacter jejuni]
MTNVILCVLALLILGLSVKVRKLEKELNYWKNYDECEEKWKKILRS